MPSVKVMDANGKEVEKINLSDAIFGIKPNKAVMHELVVNHLANKRQGTQSTLTSSEVSGGGKKPWKQKGTGRARQGSTRNVQWTHGGVAFAPKPRDYSYCVNKKVRRLAMKSAFSSKLLDEDLIVLNELKLDDFSTKKVIEVLNNLGANKKALIVLDTVDKKAIKSSNNIPGVKTTQVNTLNVYDMLNTDKLIILKDAVSKIEEVYA